MLTTNQEIVNEIRNEILRTKYEIMIAMKKKENRLIDLIFGIRNDINKNIEGNTLHIAKFISTSNIEDAKQFNSIAKQIDMIMLKRKLQNVFIIVH
ncbi:MAG: hypothetical protein IJU54_01910 [Alphaproteobacteria bacterium]|nr:hypothetical protein [Alphaproteobacteria bacterium]